MEVEPVVRVYVYEPVSEKELEKIGRGIAEGFGTPAEVIVKAEGKEQRWIIS